MNVSTKYMYIYVKFLMKQFLHGVPDFTFFFIFCLKYLASFLCVCVEVLIRNVRYLIMIFVICDELFMSQRSTKCNST